MKAKPERIFIHSIIVFLLIIGIVVAGFYLNRPPRVVSENAPSDVFSAERAVKYLTHITEKPHYIGTDEHLKVRNYIIDELKQMGIQPELQIAEVYYPDSYIAATVGNIIVKIPGRESGKAVLLVGHYDSVEGSYGASDDGTAVAAMLETIRVLQNTEPLNNDIIFLFSDAEEVGLLGAKAFIEQHPLAKEIGVVLNFEASGTSGPSMMFETSNDNNRLISEFAKAAPYPNANSISYEIYRNMPNDTDLTPFKENGIPGLNFAYIDNRFDYHSGGDNIENTSMKSLQHHGSYAVALTRHFGNIDLDFSEKGNAVYFNPVGNLFVHYSYKWIVPFIVLTCLFLLVILVIGFRLKIIRPFRLLFGFFAFIIHLAITPAIVTCLYFIIIKYYPGYDFRLLFYNQKLLMLGFVCLAITVSFLYYHLLMRGIKIWQVLVFLISMLILLLWSSQISIITALAAVVVSVFIFLLFRKPTQVAELTLGSFIGWTILMIVSGIIMPGASYLFTWPLMFSIIPIGTCLYRNQPGEYSITQTGLFDLFALPVLLWFSGFTFMFLLAMGLKMAGAAILFTVLCLSLLIPHIGIITRLKPWLVPVVAFVLGLFFILLGSVNLNYNERYRKENSLLFATNGNTNETFLSSLDSKSDEWTVLFLTDKPTKSKLNDFYAYLEDDFMIKPIDTEPIPFPNIEVLRDTVFEDIRLLKLHLNSDRNANSMFIQIKSDSVTANINNSEMKALRNLNRTDWKLIRYFGFPDEGVEMELKFTREQTIEIRLTDIVYGLPEIPGIEIPQRPNYMMAKGDKTLATKSYIY